MPTDGRSSRADPFLRPDISCWSHHVESATIVEHTADCPTTSRAPKNHGYQPRPGDRIHVRDGVSTCYAVKYSALLSCFLERVFRSIVRRRRSSPYGM